MNAPKFLSFCLLCLVFAFQACDDDKNDDGTIDGVKSGTEDFVWIGENVRYLLMNGEALALGTVEDFDWDGFSGEITFPEYLKCDRKTFPVTKIETEAFKNCTKLGTVVFSRSMGTIATRAFYGCTNLYRVEFCYLHRYNVSLENFRFAKTGLTDAVLPANTTYIGDGAFSDCPNLRFVKCDAPTPPELGSDVFSGTHSGLTITVPRASVEEYKTKWSAYADKIEGTNY